MSNRTPDTKVDTDQFSREIAGLPDVQPPETVELSDGEQFDIEIAPVAKRLGDVTVRMLAYNRSIPGPTLKVRQDSEVLVNVTNHGDLEATVHWHGVRIENRYDGTHQTQAPIEVGESFTYHVQFPDPGVYWYHPHIREDYGQELGLYGNIIVVPDGARVLAAGQPRAAAHARRRVARRRGQDRALQPPRDDVRGHGPLRQCSAHRRRNRPRTPCSTRRGPALPLHRHGQHARLQGRPAGSTYEARRRRQRAPRARGIRRGRPLGAVGAGRRRRALRRGRGVDARAPHARAHVCARQHHRRRGTGRAVVRQGVRGSAYEPRSCWRSANGSLPTSTHRRTRFLPSSRRWTWVARRSRQARSTPAPCIRRSSPPGPASAPSAG